MARQTRPVIAAPVTRLDVRGGQQLIAIPWLDGDAEVVSYFNDEAAAWAFLGKRIGNRPTSMIGAPKKNLDQTIPRHESDGRRRESTPQADASMPRPERQESVASLVARPGQSLVAIPDEVAGETVLRYFVDKQAARAFADERMAEGRPLGWIGAWADLDWEEFAEEIERIRHESTPTPPIDDL